MYHKTEQVQLFHSLCQLIQSGSKLF